MKHGRIGNENALREAPQIRTLISDLDRIVQILNCGIATEEERVRVFDRSDVTYPLLAITLAARRDNLRDTIAVFEQRLATIKSTLGRADRGLALLVRMHPNVGSDLAYVCQLDGCAQRLGSAKQQRKLAPPDCF
jgi:hypothetical protein